MDVNMSHGFMLLRAANQRHCAIKRTGRLRWCEGSWEARWLDRKNDNVMTLIGKEFRRGV